MTHKTTQGKILLSTFLALLMAVQLTGLTCLGEPPLHDGAGEVDLLLSGDTPAVVVSSEDTPWRGEADGTLSPEDGCPCHAVFATLSLSDQSASPTTRTRTPPFRLCQVPVRDLHTPPPQA